MEKIIKWLKEEVSKLRGYAVIIDGEDGEWEPVTTVSMEDVYGLINQLDKIEVLSQEWIDKHSYNVHLLGTPDVETVAIPRDDLQNQLVPKQEELEVKIQELIEVYKQEDGAYSNPENGWIGGFIEGLKNLLEEEQKYYVVDNEYIPLLQKGHGYVNRASTGLSIFEKGRDNDQFALTEQEIKDYDERYWSFAVKVKEEEE